MYPRSEFRGLYAITDAGLVPDEQLLQAVEGAILGGARLVQFREKRTDTALRLRLASALVKTCREHDVPLIINDDIELALASGADGVHLGRDDAGLARARKQLGPQAIIGISCYNDLDRARQAEQSGADYVAFGSFFPSAVKPDAASATLDLLRSARQQLALPIVAIGGIETGSVESLIDAGADMVAVISGLFAQPDPLTAAQNYSRPFFDHTNQNS